ncbi:MAG TPA: hypothetical protein VM557_03395 [Thermoanaerobaculia bacterium]|nr:hypothetical protein [Thermoanaerobaculia bacterium]
MTYRSSLRFLSLLTLLLVPAAAMAGDDGLSLVPVDAAAVGVAHIDQVRSGALAAKLFAQTDRMTIDGEGARLLAQIGLDPTRDIDTVTFALAPKKGAMQGGNPLVILEGRFDQAKMIALIEEHGAVKRNSGNRAYYVAPEKVEADHEGAVAFLSGNRIVAGSEEAVIEALANAEKGGSAFRVAGALSADLPHIDAGASAWALVDVPRAARLSGNDPWSGTQDHPGQMLMTSMKKVSAFGLWTTESGEKLYFGATALSSDPETRQLLEDATRGVLAAWRLAAQESEPELVNVIRQFNVKQTSLGVTISGTVTSDMFQNFAKKSSKM